MAGDSEQQGTVMAALAVVGGVDDRLRLGGQVTYPRCGTGTVAHITTTGRITIQFHAPAATIVCRLPELTVVIT